MAAACTAAGPAWQQAHQTVQGCLRTCSTAGRRGKQRQQQQQSSRSSGNSTGHSAALYTSVGFINMQHYGRRSQPQQFSISNLLMFLMLWPHQDMQHLYARTLVVIAHVLIRLQLILASAVACVANI
jgi:hypothetical protein